MSVNNSLDDPVSADAVLVVIDGSGQVRRSRVLAGTV